ncbi:MAG: helix-turn-helix domain-containing protein [Pseudomonadota bacterium]
MSIRLMAEAWSREDIEDAPELLVLLALCDFADDDGWCWPSMIALGEKARMSDRQARTYVRRLEARGLLECPSTKGGKGKSNRYRVGLIDETRKLASDYCNDAEAKHKAETRNSASEYEDETRKPTSDFKGGNPEAEFRVQTRKGGSTASQRRKPTSEEPSGTIKTHMQPQPRVADRKIEARNAKPDDFPSIVRKSVAAEYILHRRNIKAPLTTGALRLLSTELQRIVDAGSDPNAALELAMLKGWRGIKLDWVQRELPHKGPDGIPEHVRLAQEQHRQREAERKAQQ